jgi:sugar lactone lactonase YvrE
MNLLNRFFIALTVAGLATVLVPVSAHASNMTFDGKGNLFVAEPQQHSIFKFTPDGTKSTFATEIENPHELICDDRDNLFVSEIAASRSSNSRPRECRARSPLASELSA